MDEETRRREEEDFQRALEISMQDRGGRSWAPAFSGPSQSGGPSTSGQSSKPLPETKPPPTQPSKSTYSPPHYDGGYAPAATPPPSSSDQEPPPAKSPPAKAQPTESNGPTTIQQLSPAVNRVRALYNFESTDAGELSFEMGDIIKVVDRGYKDWWRGQLKGRTGIFPVNYVVSVRFEGCA